MLQVTLPNGAVKEIPAVAGKHRIPSLGIEYTIIVYWVRGELEYELVGART
jgi:hypothetical protein